MRTQSRSCFQAYSPFQDPPTSNHLPYRLGSLLRHRLGPLVVFSEDLRSGACSTLTTESFSGGDGLQYGRRLDEHLVDFLDGEIGRLGVEEVHGGDDTGGYRTPDEVVFPRQGREAKRSRD